MYTWVSLQLCHLDQAIVSIYNTNKHNYAFTVKDEYFEKEIMMIMIQLLGGYPQSMTQFILNYIHH